MRTGFLLGFMVAFILILNLGSAVSLADSSIFHITGRVTDNFNGTNGVPGANVTLMSNVYMGNHGVKAVTITSNPTTTVSNGTNIGYFEFDVSQPGDYQVYAEKGGLNGSLTESDGWSAPFTVFQGTTNYSVQVVLILSLPSVTPTVTITPVPVTITLTPTAVLTPTPIDVATTVNPVTSTPMPSTENYPIPTRSSTPVSTPGVSLTFIPTLIVISIIALRKWN